MSVVAGSCLPGEPMPLSTKELKLKALHETLMVAADVAEEAGEDHVGILLRSMAGLGPFKKTLDGFIAKARQISIPSHVGRGVMLIYVEQLLQNLAMGRPPGWNLYLQKGAREENP